MKNATPDEQARTVPVDQLVPYAKNAKLHSKEQVQAIAESITQFGFTNPVLIDENGEIIAGHGRVLAAKKLGLDKVPTRTLKGMSPEQKRAYRLADNRIGEIGGGWDAILLREEHEELKSLLEFDFALTGWQESEILALSLDAEATQKESDFRYPAQKEEFVPKDTSIQNIVLIYPIDEYKAVITAMSEYAEQFGLSNNAEVVQHLLESNGYAVSVRKT